MTRRVVMRAMGLSARRVASDRSALLVSGGFYLMVTMVLASLWHAASSVNGGSVVGYSTTALVWYAATSEAATIALPQRLIEIIGEDLNNGSIEVEMLRPTSVLAVRIASETGAMLPRLAVCSVVGLAFSWMVGGSPPDGAALGLAVPALLLAVILNLVAQHLFAASAFWVHDATASWFLYQKLVFVIGGMLLPLEVLPSVIETVARFLPFMAMAYVPARLASGHFEPELIAVQVIWLAIALVATRAVFASGERRLSGADS